VHLSVRADVVIDFRGAGFFGGERGAGRLNVPTLLELLAAAGIRANLVASERLVGARFVV